MYVVAALTSARRITRHRGGALAALPLAMGVAPILGALLASGLVPARPIAIVPIAGILIGGAMTVTGLAGRRALDDLRSRFGEYEAALALGFTSSQARRDIARPAAAQALFPALDQTRTVGLVTLPGAFVGVLLGGGGPLQAGAAQVLVLIGLLAAETVSVLATVELVAHGWLRRAA
jgi:putative ABC transport system permease protein